jgi:putative transposase
MELYVNMLLDWVTADGSQKVERIVRIAPANGRVYLIDIIDDSAMPYEVSAADLSAAGDNGDFRVIKEDPYVVTSVEFDIPEKHRLCRDRAWGIIADVVGLPNGQVFDKTERFRAISKASAEHDVPQISIYRYLRRYWQRGQTINSLLPDYRDCGAPGEDRPPGQAKRGRPNGLSLRDGIPRGINIGPDEKRFIELAIKLFYDDPKAPNPPTLRRAYQLMLEKYFSVGHKRKNGVLTPTIAPVHEVPTFGQFAYYHRKLKQQARSLIAREGIRRFNLKHRAIGGDAAAGAIGPGSVFQIDSTPANINLVSALDPNGRIGHPVVYSVVDVFSRLIVGFAATLEEESYLSGMLALENALVDKVEYCAAHGIQIAAESWPSHHLPESLVADRGELISKNADHLVNTLGIRITNTPAHRPDLKPHVERLFRTAQDEVVHHLPGAVNQRHERGDRDERLDAVLTLEDFRKILIHFILDFNRSRIEGFRPQEFMLRAQIEPRPIDLWKWGIENRAGHLRTMSSDLVRINLLPRSEARVTERGICFRKLFYTSDTVLKEQWQVKARSNRSWKVAVAYDPLNTSSLYRVAEKGFEICRLLPASAMFAGRCWCEVDDFCAGMKELKDRSATRELQSKADRNAQINTIVQEAVLRQEGVERPESKAAALRHIRENRKAERDRERLAAAGRARAPLPLPTEQTLMEPAAPAANGDGYVPPPWDFALLREQREKHRRAK